MADETCSCTCCRQQRDITCTMHRILYTCVNRDSPPKCQRKVCAILWEGCPNEGSWEPAHFSDLQLLMKQLQSPNL